MTTTRLMCACCSTPAKPRRATEGYRTCDACSDRIADALREIPAQYKTLTTVSALLPGVGEEGRRGPGFGSRSPIRLDVVVVTDWRTRWSEDDRVHNPLALLGKWADVVRGEVGEASPATATIDTESALLIRRLDHATRQPWIAGLWREVRECRGQLRTIAGEPRPRYVGLCPAIPEGQTEECGARLYVRQGTDTITCVKCREQWPRARWQVLGRAIGVLP